MSSKKRLAFSQGATPPPTVGSSPSGTPGSSKSRTRAKSPTPVRGKLPSASEIPKPLKRQGSETNSETSHGSAWSNNSGGSMVSHEGRLGTALTDLHGEGIHRELGPSVALQGMSEKAITEVAPVMAELLTTLTNMESPVVVMNTSCIALVVSPSVARVFGYTTEEIAGHNVNMLMPKAIAVQHDAIVARYSAQTSTVAQRSTIVNNVRPTIGLHKDGSAVPIDVSVRVIRSAQKYPALYIAVIRDTRNEHLMRSALRESKFLEASFPFPYIRCDELGIIETFNPAAEQTFGMSASFATGKNVKIILPKKLQAQHDGFVQAYVRKLKDLRGKDAIQSKIVGKKSRRMAMRLACYDNGTVRLEMLPVELQLDVNLATDGTIKFFAFIRDLNTFASQEEREDEKRRADMALRIKDAFVASLSHEIRTPLNGILGAIEMLVDQQLTDAQAELVSIASDCGSTLLSTINTILDYSKGEAGMVEIEEAVFVVRDAVDAAVRTVNAGARNKDTNLEVNMSPDIPAVLLGDVVKIRQVLCNLLSNAVKFTPTNGTVTLTVSLMRDGDEAIGESMIGGLEDVPVGTPVHSSRRIGSPEARTPGGTAKDKKDAKGKKHKKDKKDGGKDNKKKNGEGEGEEGEGESGGEDEVEEIVTVRFEVKDTGIGIAPDKVNTVFDAFAQADPSIARRFGGTGLGLFICRRLVSGMGGEIFCESEEGKGSTFTFTCPFKRTHYEDHHRDNEHPGDASRDASGVSAGGTSNRRQIYALVVDDFDVNVLVIKTLLKHIGCKVLTSLSGAGAIAILNEHDVDIVFSDLNMPEMDGLQLTREIKNSGNDVPVVIVTAGGSSRKEEAEQAGAVGFLEKPVNKDELEEQLAAHTHHERTVAVEVSLVHADDARVNGSIVKEMASSVQAAHLWVPTGADALRAVASYWSAKHGVDIGIEAFIAKHGGEPSTWDVPVPNLAGPLVVLLDRYMPGLSGTQTASMIRKIEARYPILGRVPIVLLTGDAGEEVAAAAKEAGIDRTLTKPVRRSELIRSLRSCVRNSTNASTVTSTSSEASSRKPRRAERKFIGGKKKTAASDALATPNLPDVLAEKAHKNAFNSFESTNSAATDISMADSASTVNSMPSVGPVPVVIAGHNGDGPPPRDSPEPTTATTPSKGNTGAGDNSAAEGGAADSPASASVTQAALVNFDTLHALTPGDVATCSSFVTEFLESAVSDLNTLASHCEDEEERSTLGDAVKNVAHKVAGAAMSLGLDRLGLKARATEKFAANPSVNRNALPPVVKSLRRVYDDTAKFWATQQ